MLRVHEFWSLNSAWNRGSRDPPHNCIHCLFLYQIIKHFLHSFTCVLNAHLFWVPVLFHKERRILQKAGIFQHWAQMIELNFREKKHSMFPITSIFMLWTIFLYYVIKTFEPYSFKISLLWAIFYIFILHFLLIPFPKYTHISSLLSTIPWDREHVGDQKKMAKEVERSCGK